MLPLSQPNATQLSLCSDIHNGHDQWSVVYQFDIICPYDAILLADYRNQMSSAAKSITILIFTNSACSALYIGLYSLEGVVRKRLRNLPADCVKAAGWLSEISSGKCWTGQNVFLTNENHSCIIRLAKSHGVSTPFTYCLHVPLRNRIGLRAMIFRKFVRGRDSRFHKTKHSSNQCPRGGRIAAPNPDVRSRPA